MTDHHTRRPTESAPVAWRALRWALYVVAAVYFALSAAAAWGHLHGKNLTFWQELFKNSMSEEKNAAAYRGEVGAPPATASSATYPLTDARYSLANGVTVRNLGVVHMYDFFHAHRGEILGAVKGANAIAAEQGTFFDHCEAYARANGVTVADLDESRKRDRAATWGFLVAMIDILVATVAVMAVCIVASRRLPDRFHPDRHFRWRSALAGFPNLRTAYGAWLCEWRRQAAARTAHPVPKRTFRDQMADFPPALRGMIAPGHRTGTWVAGAALIMLLGTHAIFTWGVIDPSGSQSSDPGSPALSQWVDRFSADVDQPKGTERTLSNSAMLHDSRSMFENAKRIAQRMTSGSTLLVVTGDRHAKDFEPWFRADHDFSALPAAAVAR